MNILNFKPSHEQSTYRPSNWSAIGFDCVLGVCV